MTGMGPKQLTKVKAILSGETQLYYLRAKTFSKIQLWEKQTDHTHVHSLPHPQQTRK